MGKVGPSAREQIVPQPLEGQHVSQSMNGMMAVVLFGIALMDKLLMVTCISKYK